VAPVLSLLALLLTLILSMVSRINVGLIAIAAAWVLGVYFTGISAEAVLAGFPGGLFATLAGVTLLFAIAETNGTLAGAATFTFRLARGSSRILPLLLFCIAFALAASGPGAVPAVALIIPLAMALGARANLPPLLTALMVANGANAGNLSPLSAVGIIANSRMVEAGIAAQPGVVMLANLLAHVLVGGLAYLYFLLRHHTVQQAAATGDLAPVQFTRDQRWTLSVLALWMIGVVFLKLHVGLSAFAAALLLIVVRAADETTAVRKVPWGIILMVTGVSVLIALLEKNGGMAMFSQLLASIASGGTINGLIAFVTGAISTYSSTSGVVLPAFLPLIPSLVTELGSGDPLAIALSINVGSSLVDVSPLSTIGALCVAAISDPALSRRTFNQLLVWGFAMIVVGAVLCQLFAGVLALQA
jgi:di/tricarboxylate transporter